MSPKVWTNVMCHPVEQIVFDTWVVAHAAGNRTGAVNGVGVPEQVLQTKVTSGML